MILKVCFNLNDSTILQNSLLLEFCTKIELLLCFLGEFNYRPQSCLIAEIQVHADKWKPHIVLMQQKILPAKRTCPAESLKVPDTINK